MAWIFHISSTNHDEILPIGGGGANIHHRTQRNHDSEEQCSDCEEQCSRQLLTEDRVGSVNDDNVKHKVTLVLSKAKRQTLQYIIILLAIASSCRFYLSLERVHTPQTTVPANLQLHSDLVNTLLDSLREGKISKRDGSQDGQTSPSKRAPRTIAFLYEHIDAKEGVQFNPFYPSAKYTHARVSPLYTWTDFNKTNFEQDSMPEDPPQITLDWYEPNAKEFIDGYDWDVCKPMYDWQIQSYPNCNKFHELDFLHMRVINSGGSRTAFEMKQQFDHGTETKFVFKTVKYENDIRAELMEEQRIDSVIMERTSSSNFIPNAWGYCSLGVMMDFMPDGNMHDYIKGVRLAGGSTLPSVDLLRISIHIATATADLHTIDNTPIPSVFHNDLCCHQFLFQDGVFKLNDFNYAKPIYINEKTKEQCTRTSFGMKMWKGRSLEEHKAYFYDPAVRPLKPENVDIWMMCNQIYTILTDLYLFEKPKNLSCVESGREMVAGRRSPFPDHIENSNDPSHNAVKNALEMCWKQNWEERESARTISDYLIGQLSTITGDENPDLRVVLPERDPNQRRTESDAHVYGGAL